jgi:two-component system, NtrC family, response regulator AlgB
MRVLIIDDEGNIRKTTALALESMGHEPVSAASREEALKQLGEAHFDVAFLDLKLDRESGLEVLPALLTAAPGLQVVVFTAFASVETAVEAIQLGAVDYVPKPFKPEQIRQTLGKILKARKLEGRVAELESRLTSDSPGVDLSSREPAMQKLLETAFKAAVTPATILLLGESGTGKTVLARFIHEKSQRKDSEFVTVSCPSLSRDLLESELFGHIKGSFTGAVNDTWGKVAAADGGSLFLDEIGELPLEIQPKLLRLLQEKEYERLGEHKVRRANVRVVAASNRNLEEATQQGRFREDLFYRLNVIALHLPPLRERLSDLMPIATGYLRFFAQQCGKRIEGFSPAATQAMSNYAWPGNLRELRNAVERAAILATGTHLQPHDLPDKLNAAAPLSATMQLQLGAKATLEELEKEHIRQLLMQIPTAEEAARVLGIDSSTLWRKRKRYGV